MQGIDISSWQSGINLAAVPCDFVIAKATEGTNYTNPDCARSVEQAISLGKCVGVYHYVAGGNAEAEADFFIDSVSGWVGRGILAIDWEQGGNSAWGDTGYLDRVVKRVISRTGIKPLIYASQAVFPWDVANSNDCGSWVAQYGSMDATGYQENPWNDGAYSCTIRQYASSGALSGYNGSLDLNKFYGTAQDWAAYSGGSGQTGGGGVGHSVQLFTPNQSDAQKWIVRLNADGQHGYATFQSKSNGQYLDVVGGGTAAGTPVQVYDGNGSAAQKFLADAQVFDADKWFYLRPQVNEAMAVDCVNGGTSDGTGIQIFDWNRTDAQKWSLVYAGEPDTYYVINLTSGKALDVVGGGI